MFQTENTKQNEFLMAIRDIGMGIIFCEATSEDLERTFVPYGDYFENSETLNKYLYDIFELAKAMDKGNCTPDDLLLTLGKYTKEIIYEDEEELLGVYDFY